MFVLTLDILFADLPDIAFFVDPIYCLSYVRRKSGLPAEVFRCTVNVCVISDET